MIKINLLPVPKARKVKEAAQIRHEIVLAGVLLGFVISGCLYFWFRLNTEINRLQDEKASINKELVVLKDKVKEVENYENNKKVLEEKNQVIKQLKKSQELPVRLLDQVSRGINPLKIWLTSLSAQGTNVDMDGKAMTNSDIVEFINNLKASKFFKDIQLVESRQAVESNVAIYNFKIRCSMVI